MPIICWNALAKSATESTTIDQEITEYIMRHDENPNAHMGADYSLGVHRLEAVLDHLPYAVRDFHIEDLAVGAPKIKALAITTDKLDNLAVTTGKIALLAVTASQIADATITASKITNATITATQIADATITAGKITNLTITADKIANLTITEGKIADLAVTNAKINDLNASKINAGYLSADRIEAGTITATKLNVSTLSAITANLGTITAGSITGVTITSATFQTKASGARVVITSDGNEIDFYASSGGAILILQSPAGTLDIEGAGYVNFNDSQLVDVESVNFAEHSSRPTDSDCIWYYKSGGSYGFRARMEGGNWSIDQTAI